MRSILVLLFLCSTHTVLAQQASSFQEAVTAFESNDFDRANKLFQTLYKDGKEAENAHYLGRIALKNENPKEAIKWLEEAVEKNEQKPEYHYWLSEAYFTRISEVGMMKKGGLAKKGKKAAERCIDLDPTHRDARTSLIYFYTQAPSIAGGSKEKAMQQADILKTHHPKRGRMMLAMVHSAQDEYDKADAEYTTLLKEFADDADLHYTAGMYFQRRKDYDQAIEIFQKAIDLDPDQLNALYQIGRTVVFANDKHEVGKEALNQYLKKDLTDDVPSYASAWWRLGMIYELAGRLSDARTAFTSALELEPDHKEAQKALKELDS